MVILAVTVFIVADDDDVLAMPANVIDAGHGECNIMCMREPCIRPQFVVPSRACGMAVDTVWTQRYRWFLLSPETGER